MYNSKYVLTQKNGLLIGWLVHWLIDWLLILTYIQLVRWFSETSDFGNIMLAEKVDTIKTLSQFLLVISPSDRSLKINKQQESRKHSSGFFFQ